MANTSNVSQPEYELAIDKNVDVQARDGAIVKADVYRPNDAGRFPALINIGAYQKDKVWIPPADLEETPNQYINWETVNPRWWVPRGYAAVRVDTRGSGKSPGQTDPFSLQGWTSTMPSSGRRTGRGATVRLQPWASPISQ